MSESCWLRAHAFRVLQSSMWLLIFGGRKPGYYFKAKGIIHDRVCFLRKGTGRVFAARGLSGLLISPKGCKNNHCGRLIYNLVLDSVYKLYKTYLLVSDRLYRRGCNYN